jgi:hypothetical protein
MARVTPAAVLEAVEAAMLRPWAWGVADCCASASDAFAALHGIDPMGRLRGACADAEGAAAVIAAEGGMVEMVRRRTAEAGLIQVALAEARPGDLGLSRSRPEGRALCVCVEPGVWAAKTTRGYALIEADMAWTCRR